MKVSSLSLKFALQIKFLNLFLLLLNSHTPKLELFIKMLNYYEIITICRSYKTLTSSFNHGAAELKIRTKSIGTCDFSTLCTKLPHDKLTFKLLSIVDFAIKRRGKNLIRLSNISDWWKAKKLDLVLLKRWFEHLYFI